MTKAVQGWCASAIWEAPSRRLALGAPTLKARLQRCRSGSERSARKCCIEERPAGATSCCQAPSAHTHSRKLLPRRLGRSALPRWTACGPRACEQPCTADHWTPSCKHHLPSAKWRSSSLELRSWARKNLGGRGLPRRPQNAATCKAGAHTSSPLFFFPNPGAGDRCARCRMQCADSAELEVGLSQSWGGGGCENCGAALDGPTSCFILPCFHSLCVQCVNRRLSTSITVRKLATCGVRGCGQALASDDFKVSCGVAQSKGPASRCLPSPNCASACRATPVPLARPFDC